MSFSTLSFIIVLIAFLALLAWGRRSARRQLNPTQLAVLFDALREAIVVVDKQLNIVHINKAAGDLLGLPARPMPHEEVTNTFEVCTPDGQVLPVELWPIGRALRDEFLQSAELLVRRKDQDRALITEITTAPLRDRSGQMTHILVTHRDVTQAKAMQESKLRLAAIVESSEDAIIGKDKDGIVTSWNAGAEKTFGYSAEEMVGESIRKLIPEDRMQEEDDILRRIRRGERVEHFETVRKTKTGKSIRMSVTVSPIHGSSGQVVGASKIARNITERKQMERQLAQSRKMEALGN